MDSCMQACMHDAHACAYAYASTCAYMQTMYAYYACMVSYTCVHHKDARIIDNQTSCDACQLYG